MWHRLASYTLLMQNREGDLDEFFAHEIQSFPPSLSDLGKLHLPNTKSDMLQCLEQPGQSEPPSTYDCIVLDGAAIVHCLPTTTISTFNEYADSIFIPYLEKQLQVATRLDLVWDTGHIYIRQFKGVYQGKERQRCAQESVRRDQTARQLDGLLA